MLFAFGSDIPSASRLHVLGLILAITLLSDIVASQYEFDACELPNHGTGICRVFEECQELVDALKRHEITINDPERCGFKGAKELICCPGSGGNLSSRDGKPAFEENQEVIAAKTENPIDSSVQLQTTTTMKPDFWLPLLSSSSTTSTTTTAQPDFWLPLLSSSSTTTAKPDFWLHLLNSTTTTPRPLVVDGQELDKNAELYDFSKLLGQKKDKNNLQNSGVSTHAGMPLGNSMNSGSEDESLDVAESGFAFGNQGLNNAETGFDNEMLNSQSQGLNNVPVNEHQPFNMAGQSFGADNFSEFVNAEGKRPVSGTLNIPNQGLSNGHTNIPGLGYVNGAVNRPGQGLNNGPINAPRPGAGFANGEINRPGPGFSSGVISQPGRGVNNAQIYAPGSEDSFNNAPANFANRPVNIPTPGFNNHNQKGFGFGHRPGPIQRNAFGLPGMHMGQVHGRGSRQRNGFLNEPARFQDRPMPAEGFAPTSLFRPDRIQAHLQQFPQVNVGMRANINARPTMQQGFHGRGHGWGHGRGQQFQNNYVNELGPLQSPPLQQPQPIFQFQDPPIMKEKPAGNPFLPSPLPTLDQNDIDRVVSNNNGLPLGQIWQDENRNEFENRNENENQFGNHLQNGYQETYENNNENPFTSSSPELGSHHQPNELSEAQLQQNVQNNIRDIFTTDFQSPYNAQELPESAIRMNEEHIDQWSTGPTHRERFLQG